MTTIVRSHVRGRRKVVSDGTMPLLPVIQAVDDAEEAERAEEEAAELVTHDRMRVHEADLSPPDMAGQSCWSLAKYIPRLMGTNVRRVLDPTAGAGCFPMAVRSEWPGAEVVACEAREEEEPHLRHHAHAVHMGDFFKADTGGGFDLVVTNPPFSLIPLLLLACLELVVPGGYVAFVCRISWGNSKETHPLMLDPPVLASHEFADRWRFRVGINPKTITARCPEGKEYGSDSVGYRLLIWQRPEPKYPVRPGAVRMVPLPWLPAECRRWRKTQGGLWVKPGTEYLCTPADPLETLPAVPWRLSA
jgi:hypothetical protein